MANHALLPKKRDLVHRELAVDHSISRHAEKIFLDCALQVFQKMKKHTKHLRSAGGKSKRAYYHEPDRGLSGTKSIEKRRSGLHLIAANASGLTVLDLGCAEGLAAAIFLDAGCSVLHGVDRKAARIEAARALFKNDPRVRFDVADIARHDFHRRVNCLTSYDIVLFLGVYQMLPKRA